jgi:hypothetical protein
VRAFIIRPFGAKEGVDFDRVERELIHPVLESLQIEGRTTGEIAEAGNIRTDMFEGLVSADLVIADISIHNANVYYELGIRHAMRDRITVLIRSALSEVPFDLTTDRYLLYDAQDPATSRPALMDAVQQSVTARRQDSPVFLLLPGLEPADPETIHPVPSDFTEEVRDARRNEDLALLAVLGEEAAMFEWGLAGRRLVGRAQFDASAWPDARATWLGVLDECPDDIEANLALGTVHQRLAQLGRSSDVLRRVLERQDVTTADRAEALALRARNAKTLWTQSWRDEAKADWRPAALRSVLLDDARTSYDEAFLADQNRWYPGVNALALSTVMLLLARDLPDVWEERFEDSAGARAALDQLQRAVTVLAAAVRRSLDAEEYRCLRSGGEPGVWWDFTRAGLQLLTSHRPQTVRTAYQRARARLAQEQGANTGFAVSSAVWSAGCTGTSASSRRTPRRRCTHWMPTPSPLRSRLPGGRVPSCSPATASTSRAAPSRGSPRLLNRRRHSWSARPWLPSGRRPSTARSRASREQRAAATSCSTRPVPSWGSRRPSGWPSLRVRTSLRPLPMPARSGWSASTACAAG